MNASNSSMPDRLMQSSPAMLETTMDQLRTLVAVHETGTALKAARLLGREQSSVQKQLDTLNRNLGALCGEPLVLKQGRGRDVVFTRTGTTLVELAEKSLRSWMDGIDSARRRTGSALTVGSTRYMLGYLLNAMENLASNFDSRGIELKIMHVRTREVFEKLRSGDVDLVCGSTVAGPQSDINLHEFDVMEWRRSGLAVVTNLSTQIMPDTSLRASELPSVPLMVSADGLIPSFLRGWLGPGYAEKLNVIAEIDAVNYGIELLQSGVVRGCMLVTRGLGDAIRHGQLADERGLRVLELDDNIGLGLDVLIGVFTRRGEHATNESAHPLNQLWDQLRLEHERHLNAAPTDLPPSDPIVVADSWSSDSDHDR